MKGIKHLFRNKLGFIAIETVIIVGIMIGLGSSSISQFYNISQQSISFAVDNIEGIIIN